MSEMMLIDDHDKAAIDQCKIISTSSLESGLINKLIQHFRLDITIQKLDEGNTTRNLRIAKIARFELAADILTLLEGVAGNESHL